jgi:hypothetical protein
MIRMPRTAITLVLLAGLFSTTACGTVNTTSTRSAPSEDSIETNAQINDLFTEIFLHVRGVRKFPTRSGVLQAQVDVANDGFSTRGFSYLFTWQDERGNPILGPMHVWKTARVAAGGSITISSVAPGPEATDFSIQVRRAEN